MHTRTLAPSHTLPVAPQDPEWSHTDSEKPIYKHIPDYTRPHTDQGRQQKCNATLPADLVSPMLQDAQHLAVVTAQSDTPTAGQVTTGNTPATPAHSQARP